MMLQAVADILQRRQAEGWLVGGTVRDRELGRCSPDVDVAVAGDAAIIAREVAGVLGASWFALSKRHEAYRVVGRSGRVDVASVRGGGIVADLAERDFTINAMAIRLGEESLIDPFGGLTHLREGRLVAVSDRIFNDDPLRLMRVPRFCHVLGLQPDGSLARSVKAHARGLTGVAGERVFAEVALTLAAGRTADAVRSWHDLGLLEAVMPEVLSSGRFEPSVAVLAPVDEILDRPAAWFPAAADPLLARLSCPVDGATVRPVALRLAGLAHRLTPEEAAALGRRLRLSAAMVSLLRTVSRIFSRLGEGPAGRPAPPLPVSPADGVASPGRASVAFLWDTAPWEPEAIILEAAGVAAKLGPSATRSLPDAPGLLPARGLMALWGERAVHGIPRPPLDGNRLMRDLSLDRGPVLGRVLREVRLAWEAGEVCTVEHAMAVARGAMRDT